MHLLRPGIHGAGIVPISQAGAVPAGGVVNLLTYYIELDGDSSYIDCGSDVSLDNIHAAAFTVDAWVRHRQNGEMEGVICSKGDMDAGTGWRFAFSDRTSFDDFALGGAAYYDIAPALSYAAEYIALNTWVHVVASYDHAVDRKISLAVNGQWCGLYETQDAGDGDVVTDAGDNLLIGTCVAGIWQFLEGDIAWLRISTGIRYPIGINFTPPDRCQPPVVDGTTTELWAMDEGAGVLTVATVNTPANDGAMTDCVWWECTD